MTQKSKQFLQRIRTPLDRHYAEVIIKEEVSDAVSITADSMIMCFLIALRERGYGQKRIDEIMADVQEICDLSADRYTDSMAEGLHNRLQQLGVEYEYRRIGKK